MNRQVTLVAQSSKITKFAHGKPQVEVNLIAANAGTLWGRDHVIVSHPDHGSTINVYQVLTHEDKTRFMVMGSSINNQVGDYPAVSIEMEITKRVPLFKNLGKAIDCAKNQIVKNLKAQAKFESKMAKHARQEREAEQKAIKKAERKETHKGEKDQARLDAMNPALSDLVADDLTKVLDGGIDGPYNEPVPAKVSKKKIKKVAKSTRKKIKAEAKQVTAAATQEN